MLPLSLMLRAATKALHTHLLDAFPPDASYELSELSSSGMPGAIVHFLTKTLQHRADIETRRVAPDWFDGHHPDVQSSRKQYATALARHGKVPAEKWSSTTQQVLRQLLAYMIRPVPTLLNFVFQGKRNRLPAATVRSRMAYFAPYPYLHDALGNTAISDENPVFDRERLAAVLRPADRQETEALDDTGWAAYFDPLFDLYSLVDADEPSVPAELLCTALEYKTMEHLAERLRSRERQDFTKDQLRDALQKPQPVDPLPDEDTFDLGPHLDDEEFAAPPTRPSEPATTETSEPDGPVPLWMKFRGQPAAPSNPSTQNPPKEEKKSGNRPRWQQFSPLSSSGDSGPSQPGGATPSHSSEPSRPTASVTELEERILGPNAAKHRAFFIGELFRGSKEGYHRVLQSLDQADSWGEASQIIAKDVFRANSINIYSDPAVLFTDLVEERFRREA